MSDDGPSKGERTRQSILDAAYALFLAQGYHGTSMRQIATRAGLVVGGIYNHFSSKEDIFSQLVLDRHPYRQVMPIILASPAGDIETFVRAGAQTMVAELGKRPDFIKLMMIEMVEFNGRNMPGIVEQILPQVLPLIRRFDGQKRLRRMPPFIFFRAFLGFFFSYYITELVVAGTPAALTQRNALDHFVDIFLHGILAEEESA